jgi:hypothetical protein
MSQSVPALGPPRRSQMTSPRCRSGAGGPRAASGRDTGWTQICPSCHPTSALGPGYCTSPYRMPAAPGGETGEVPKDEQKHGSTLRTSRGGGSRPPGSPWIWASSAPYALCIPPTPSEDRKWRHQPGRYEGEEHHWLPGLFA